MIAQSCFLSWAEYAQNSICKPSTSMTPFECVLGFQPLLFPWSGVSADLPTVDHWMHRSNQVWDAAYTHLQCAVHQQKIQVDWRRHPFPMLFPGQRVWLSTRDLLLPGKKPSPRYVVLFKIISQINPATYKLLLPFNYLSHFPCFSAEIGGSPTEDPTPPPPLEVNGPHPPGFVGADACFTWWAGRDTDWRSARG